MKPSQLERFLWRSGKKPPDSPGTRLIPTLQSDIRVRDSGGQKPAVAFLCDPPITVEAYDELLELLQADFRILVVELPGFGFSAPRSAEAYGFDAAVEGVEEALAARHTGPIVIAGPCICGFVATAVAGRGNLDVKGLILMQTPDLSGMEAWSNRMDPKGRLHTPYLGQLLVRLNAKRLAQFWIGYATACSSDSATLTATTIAALRAGAAYPLATMLQKWANALTEQAVDIPALAVWGRSDRSHTHTDPNSTLRHAPQAHVLQFERCGHFVELEDSAGFVAAVTPFLERYLISRSAS